MTQTLKEAEAWRDRAHEAVGKLFRAHGIVRDAAVALAEMQYPPMAELRDYLFAREAVLSDALGAARAEESEAARAVQRAQWRTKGWVQE